MTGLVARVAGVGHDRRVRSFVLPFALVACGTAQPPPSSQPPRPRPTPSPEEAVVSPSCAVVLTGWQATLENVSFAYGSTTFTDRKKACCALSGVATLLRDNPSYSRVAIEGHTDERGNDAYNDALSEQRAASIIAVLIDLGVEPPRLVPLGLGERCPIDPVHNEAAWAKNRRFVLTVLEQNGQSLGNTASCGAMPTGKNIALKLPTLDCR
jgi:outer membrane protein OmpA-like peptidoglycan-associated protein